MPSRYVRRTKPYRKYKTTRKTYTKKGVTVGLIKKVIHTENEKKFKSYYLTTSMSANQYTYVVDNVTYNAPVLMNFWNAICDIKSGTAFNERESAKIFITKISWRINIRL